MISRAIALEAKRSAFLVFVGCVVLSLGVLVYLADRAGSHAGLVAPVPALGGRNLFGTLGQWLPSFVHPFAFSLFTAAVLKPGAASYRGACVFWGVVNVAFEFGQHPALNALWIAALHGSAGDWATGRWVLNYFLHGTFDVYDVCAAILGSLAAGVVLHFSYRFKGAHHA